MFRRSLHTIRRAVTVVGRGYWSGRECRVELRPAAAGAGVTFVRQVAGRDVRIPALVAARVDAASRTNLRSGGAGVEMVEHLLAALAGLGVDCCTVHLSAEELPGLDGSALAFVEAIDSVGLETLAAAAEPVVVAEPMRVGDTESWIELGPPRCAGLSVEYELDYGPGPIGRQRLALAVTPDSFREQLAAARTFLSRQEAAGLQAAGLGLGVTHRDLLVFDDHGPIDNPLRWPDECVRHKVLDLVGDLSLAGRPVHAHVRARRSGHRLNGAAAARLAAAAPLRASA